MYKFIRFIRLSAAQMFFFLNLCSILRTDFIPYTGSSFFFFFLMQNGRKTIIHLCIYFFFFMFMPHTWLCNSVVIGPQPLVERQEEVKYWSIATTIRALAVVIIIKKNTIPFHCSFVWYVFVKIVEIMELR